MDTDTNSTTSTEGTIPFTVHGETYQTWYKVFGDLTTRTKRPLVVLHGGPGLSHDYMLPLSDLAQLFSIPVVFYDQLGTARSTHLPEQAAEFWTIDLFIDELVNLLSYLGIANDYDILGHSWGGMLGAEFVVRRQPAGLQHLILANSLTEMSLWNESHVQLRKTCPQEVQDALREHEAAGTIWSPEYQEATLKFYEKYACLMRPIPKELVFSLQQDEEDHTVSLNM
jgi:proline-specific peptidase